MEQKQQPHYHPLSTQDIYVKNATTLRISILGGLSAGSCDCYTSLQKEFKIFT